MTFRWLVLIMGDAALAVTALYAAAVMRIGHFEVSQKLGELKTIYTISAFIVVILLLLLVYVAIWNPFINNLNKEVI